MAVQTARTTKTAKSVTSKVPAVSVRAAGRFIRVAPRKVRLVADSIRGKSVSAALELLLYINKGAADPLIKLVRSAAANAAHDYKIEKEDLVIKTISVNGGPTLKRFQPRAHGRSTPILKRTSHVNLELSVRPGAAVAAKAVSAKIAKTEEVKVLAPEAVKKEALATGGQDNNEEGKQQKGFLRKVFSRKTG